MKNAPTRATSTYSSGSPLSGIPEAARGPLPEIPATVAEGWAVMRTALSEEGGGASDVLLDAFRTVFYAGAESAWALLTRERVPGEFGTGRTLIERRLARLTVELDDRRDELAAEMMGSRPEGCS